MMIDRPKSTMVCVVCLVAEFPGPKELNISVMVDLYAYIYTHVYIQRAKKHIYIYNRYTHVCIYIYTHIQIHF